MVSVQAMRNAGLCLHELVDEWIWCVGLVRVNTILSDSKA